MEQKLNTKTFFLLFAAFLPVSLHAQSIGIPCKSDCHFSDLVTLINNIMNFAIIVAPILAAIAFAFAGFFYVTSTGDPGKVERAHDIFRNTAIGLIIVLAAWFVVRAILIGIGVAPGFRSLFG